MLCSRPMTRRLTRPAFFLSLLVPALGSAASVAVLPLESEAPRELAQNVEHALRTAVDEAPDLDDKGPVAMTLEEARMSLACFDESAECMARVGALLEAERLVFGRLTQRDGSYVLTLRMVDVASAKDVEPSREYVVEGGEGAVERLETKARAFVLGERSAAITLTALTVTSDPAGAQVEIDGAYAGETPVTVQAEPGPHRVSVRFGDGPPVLREVHVQGAAQEVPFVLPARPLAGEPPAGRVEGRSSGLSSGFWWGVTTGGLALASAGVATWYGVRVLDLQEEAETAPQEELADLEDEFGSARLISNVAWGVAGAAAATSIYFFFFHEDQPDLAVAPSREGLLLYGRF